jgi:hypothetical protein
MSIKSENNNNNNLKQPSVSTRSTSSIQLQQQQQQCSTSSTRKDQQIPANDCIIPFGWITIENIAIPYLIK